MMVRSHGRRCVRMLLAAGLSWLAAGAFGVSAQAQSGDAPAPADPALQTYLAANGFLNRGLHELAAVEYRKFLAEHGDHEKAPIAQYGLGVCLFRMKQYDATIAQLADLKTGPEFPFAAETTMILGQSHLARREYGPAADRFAALLRDHAGHDLGDDASAGLVEANYYLNDDDQTIAAARTFAARWPDSPLLERTLFFHGLAEMGKRDYSAASEQFEAIGKRFPDGALASRALLLLGQCHQRDHLLERAVRAYRTVIAQAKAELLPDALFGLATVMQDAGKPTDAGDLATELLTKFPDSPLSVPAKLCRGRAMLDQQRFEQAASDFQDVAATDGEFADDGRYWMGKCRLRQGDAAAAVRAFAETIEKFPNSELRVEAYYDLAVAQMRGEQYEAASETFRKFRSQFPRHALAGDALRLGAEAEHRQGHYDRSRDLCREFLEQYAADISAADVAFLAAENDYLEKRFSESVEGFRRFLAEHPKHDNAIKAKFRLGLALYQIDRLDEAKAALSEVSDAAVADPAFRAALLVLGDISFARSEWKEAEARFGAYVSGDGDVISADDALLKLGLSRQRQDKHEEALQAYATLIQRFPESPRRWQALFEQGQCYVAVQRPDEARRSFEAVLAGDGHSEPAAYAAAHLGALTLHEKRYSEAVRRFDQVLSLQAPAELRSEALFQQGQALMADGQFEQAAGRFGRLADEFPSFAEMPRAQALRAVCTARQDRCEQALQAIEQVEKQFGDRLDKTLRGEATYEKAWCLRRLGRPGDAAKAYRALLRDNADSPLAALATLELAEIEMDNKRFDAAADLLRSLRAGVSGEAVAKGGAGSGGAAGELGEQTLYRLGICEFELSRFAEAAEALEGFVSSYPDSKLLASGAYYCGESLVKSNRHERATAYLKRVAEEFKSDPVCEPALLRLGECLAVLQRWPASEQAMMTYLDLFADSEHAYQARFGLGWARENQQRYDEAIPAYRQVIAGHQGPTAARAQFQIGECLFAQKKHDEAVAELLKVDILYAYPQWSAAALYEAGRCFEKLNKPAEARDQYRKVAQDHPDTEWAALAGQRLTQAAANATHPHKAGN